MNILLGEKCTSHQCVLSQTVKKTQGQWPHATQCPPRLLRPVKTRCDCVFTETQAAGTVEGTLHPPVLWYIIAHYSLVNGRNQRHFCFLFVWALLRLVWTASGVSFTSSASYQRTFSIMDQIIKLFSSVSHTFSVTATQLCCCSTKYVTKQAWLCSNKTLFKK